MTLALGYAMSTLIFLGFFALTLAPQVASKRYHAFLYWAVVVATTTVGTTMSDYLDRTLQLGYVVSSILLFRRGSWPSCSSGTAPLGRIEFDHITTRPHEVFYWVTILVSNTLGTAPRRLRGAELGPRIRARRAGLRRPCSPLVAAAHFFTPVQKSVIFWAAYVLTRPPRRDPRRHP